MSSPSFLSYRSASLAYHFTPGKRPGVMFLGGFMSDMTGTKAVALETYCQKTGRQFVRFDYQGHGQSSGTFKEGSIGQWLQDALAIFDHVAPGPQVLAGSSMGGWIMLLLALERPERVKGLVGVASAPDFTETLLWQGFTAQQQEQLLREGVVYVPSCYGDKDYPITRALIEEGRGHLLLPVEGGIPIICPVRLLHGMRDPDVPWRISVELAEKLASQDVRVTLIKNGDHRLSEPKDIALLEAALEEILNQAQG